MMFNLPRVERRIFRVLRPFCGQRLASRLADTLSEQLYRFAEPWRFRSRKDKTVT